MWKKFLLIGAFCFLTACQSAAASSTPIALPAPTSTGASTQVTAIPLQSNEPLPPEEAGVPVRLTAPALNFAAPIETMRWQVTEVAGERKAVWEVPEAGAGWHPNSTRPGTVGNMVISGHHLLGAAVFAPLARGEFTVGTQLLVSDDQGRTFLYQVSALGEPIPVNGTAAEQQKAAAYIASTDRALLTLVTGWPAFSDTHYLFVQAEFVGILQ